MCYNKACSSEETDTAPLPWRRPIWQEPKRCWRDHCHLGPNEIQLSPNVRQDDSTRWATWQAVRQTGKQTDANIHVYIQYMHTHAYCIHIYIYICIRQKARLLFSSEVTAFFQFPVVLLVLHWLTAILRHKHRLSVSCLKFEKALQEKSVVPSSFGLTARYPGPIFHRQKMLRNH